MKPITAPSPVQTDSSPQPTQASPGADPPANDNAPAPATSKIPIVLIPPGEVSPERRGVLGEIDTLDLDSPVEFEVTSEKERAMGWAPVVPVDPRGRRCSANALDVTALVLDSDKSPDVMRLVGALSAMGYEFLVHTTHGHTSENPRYRIILPFAEPAPAQLWRETWVVLTRELLPDYRDTDKQCKDPFRLYYVPSHPPGADHESAYQEGRRLDWRDFADQVAALADEGDEYSSDYKGAQFPAIDDPASVVKAICASYPDRGERHEFRLVVAGALCRAGYPEKLAARLLAEGSRGHDARSGPDESKAIVDAHACVRSTFARAKARQEFKSAGTLVDNGCKELADAIDDQATKAIVGDLEVTAIMQTTLKANATYLRKSTDPEKAALGEQIEKAMGNAGEQPPDARALARLFPKGDSEDIAGQFPGRPEGLAAEIRREQMRMAANKVLRDRTRTERDASYSILELPAKRHEKVQHCIAALTNADVYQRPGQLLHVTRSIDRATEEGVERQAGTQTIRDLSTEHLQTILSRLVILRAHKKDSDEPVDHEPSRDIASAVHATREWSRVKPLRGIVEYPVLRPDGTVLCSPGYDPALRVLSSYDGALVLPDKPSLSDAQAAVEVLRDLVKDFPFAKHEKGAKDLDFAVWVAALCTPIARLAVDLAPAFLFEADNPGAGKTKLAKLIGIIMIGVLPAQTAPNSPDEWEKVLLSVAKAGDPIVLFDNVVHMLQSARLDSMLTDNGVTGRNLGVNEHIRVNDYRATMLFTANNATMSPDLVQRMLSCRLEHPNPSSRSGFTHSDVEAYAREHRDQLLGAALTILRAYAVAGRPSVESRAFGRFPQWARVVRDALVWAGLPDVAATKDRLLEHADVRSNELADVLAAWYALTQEQVTVKELLGLAVTGTDLGEALRGWSKDGMMPNAQTVSYRLRSSKGATAGLYRLKCCGRDANTTKWKVEKLK